MQKPNYKLNLTGGQITKIFITALSIFTTTTSIAAVQNNETANISATAYVDSVTQWGAWELDIEPAAGGLTPPTAQALNARGSKLSLRTNSISALTAIPPVPAQIPPVSTPATPVGPSGPVGPSNFAPPAATPAVTIIVNLPPSTNVTPVDPGTIPSGSTGLF